MSPTEGLDGVTRVQVVSVGVDVPDSLKQALGLADQLAGSSSLSVPMGPVSRNMLVSASAALSSASCGGGAFEGYTKSKVAFAPEEIPNIAPQGIEEDKYIPDSYVPLGFSFNFHGNNYDRVNVYSNGFLLFGTPPATPSDGFFRGGVIHSVSNPNNLIAFAWADWSPQLVPDGIRFETRGAAPHRRFILQFTNVPEYNSASKVGAIKAGVGRLMAQVVLSEGTNEITIYTNTMTLTNSTNKYTQGIENALGTEAKYDSIQNPTTLVWSARVNKFFTGIKLTNDAVRFSPNSVSDKEIPSITAPANITDKGNDPGLASAVVAVGSPVYSDNCTDVTVSSARSDGFAIEAPYPVGTTTITWTAKDAAGNAASATQSVTVLDKEAPVFASSTQSILKVNATSPSGAVVTYSVNASDNVGVTSLTCAPTSGSVFPVGTRQVSCSASDAAGNSSSKSFSVFVVDAHTQVGDLLDYVRSLNLPNGTVQPLINQLRSAYKEQGNECKKMADFIDMVHKNKSNIDYDFVRILTVRAAEIRGAWGCEGAEPPPVSGSSQPRTSQMNF